MNLTRNERVGIYLNNFCSLADYLWNKSKYSFEEEKRGIAVSPRKIILSNLMKHFLFLVSCTTRHILAKSIPWKSFEELPFLNKLSRNPYEVYSRPYSAFLHFISAKS